MCPKGQGAALVWGLGVFLCLSAPALAMEKSPNMRGSL